MNQAVMEGYLLIIRMNSTGRFYQDIGQNVI
jgi:hypothetical protein